MNKKWIATALAASVIGAAIAQAPAIDNARVNAMYTQIEAQQMAQQGVPIPAQEVDNIKKEISKNLQQAELLKNAALKEGLDQKPAVKAAFANFEAQFYASEYFNHLKATIEITDQDVSNEYNKLSQEIKIQQIAFASLEEAQNGQALLLKGMTFENLAKKQGQTEGFQSDWMNSQGLPPEIAGVVGRLVKKEITAEPVKLGENFYLFRVVDTRRGSNIPPLAQIKDQLIEQMRATKATAKITEMMKAAGLE